MRALAPGKVVVAGEYAVLDGAPALVAAVPIGVGAHVAASEALQIHTPRGDDRFVRAALGEVGITSGTWTFTDEGAAHLASKPGLGGSAAATVAAVALARAVQGQAFDAVLIQATATRVHRAVQGSGSGIDVAASTWGGLLRFTTDGSTRPVSGPRLVVAWTGTSASTGPRVARYLAWADRAAFVRASEAVVLGFDADPVGALAENERLLRSMAQAADVPWATPELDTLTQLAVAAGGAGKPSGAGGGDCHVAVFASEDAETTYVSSLTAAGFTLLCRTLAPGVAVTA